MNKTQTYWHLFQTADPSWIKNNPGKWAEICEHIKKYGRFVGLRKANHIRRRTNQATNF
jgi:hypothetical protein